MSQIQSAYYQSYLQITQADVDADLGLVFLCFQQYNFVHQVQLLLVSGKVKVGELLWLLVFRAQV